MLMVTLAADATCGESGCCDAVDALGRLSRGEAGEVAVHFHRPRRDLSSLIGFLESAIGLGVPTAAIRVIASRPGSR